MSTYTTTVTIPVTINAADIETAIKLAELAAANAAATMAEYIETVAGEPTLDRITRVPGVDRVHVARQAVRKAIGYAVIPHHHMQTAPHPREIRDIALADAGIELTPQEVHAATMAVMAE